MCGGIGTGLPPAPASDAVTEPIAGAAREYEARVAGGSGQAAGSKLFSDISDGAGNALDRELVGLAHRRRARIFYPPSSRLLPSSDA